MLGDGGDPELPYLVPAMESREALATPTLGIHMLNNNGSQEC